MIRPIRDVIIVKKKNDEEAKSIGGIIIPMTASDNKSFFEGTVVATGDGILTDSGKVVELQVKAGDRIIFGKSGSVDIQIDGENYVMMRENNILGII